GQVQRRGGDVVGAGRRGVALDDGALRGRDVGRAGGGVERRAAEGGGLDGGGGGRGAGPGRACGGDGQGADAADRVVDGPPRPRPRRAARRARRQHEVVAGLQDDVAGAGREGDAGVDGQVVARGAAFPGRRGQVADAAGVDGEGDRAGGHQRGRRAVVERTRG